MERFEAARRGQPVSSRYNFCMVPPSPSTPDFAAQGTHRAVLAIDYGRKRIGLALSDESGQIARPLCVLPRTNRRSDVTRIREFCRHHGVGSVVVGWPVRLDGTPGEMAAEAERFAERLRKHLGLPVELIDERLSSWEATQVAAQSPVRGKESAGKKSSLDDLAAAVILRDYLSRSGRTSRG